LGTTYRATNARGIKMLIELDQDTPVVGETLRGTFAFEGDARPKISGGTASLVATTTTTSTDVDLFATLGQLVDPAGFEDDSDGPIATKTSKKLVQLANLTAPLHLESASGGAATFQIAIPLDAPARISSSTFAIRWTLMAKADTDLGPVAVNVADLPVGIAAGTIDQTSHLEEGALQKIFRGTNEDVEWSIEMDDLPLITGRPLRGTFLVPNTERWRKLRPEVRLSGGVVRNDSTRRLLDQLERANVTDDSVEADGQRRIRFEGTVPATAGVTTGSADTRFVATVQVALVRFGLFGPKFNRPVALASRD
jgi:hypothetical protein